MIRNQYDLIWAWSELERILEFVGIYFRKTKKKERIFILRDNQPRSMLNNEMRWDRNHRRWRGILEVVMIDWCVRAGQAPRVIVCLDLPRSSTVPYERTHRTSTTWIQCESWIERVKWVLVRVSYYSLELKVEWVEGFLFVGKAGSSQKQRTVSWFIHSGVVVEKLAVFRCL